MKLILTIGFICTVIPISISLRSNDFEADYQGDAPISHQQEQSPNYAKTHRLAFLDKVLEGYDKRAWPTYGENRPTEVKVNIHVNSIGPIVAANMEYGMDIYLRQSWNDKRLNLSRFGINTTVALNGEDLMEKIWKPDLFFRNVKRAAFHRVTVPNMLVRIAPDGQVLYSMRLTLSLACVMVFRYYPLDTQKCNVILGAYAQTIDQTRISWQEHKPIVIESPIELPEFDLTGHTHGSFTRSVDTGTFSFLNVTLTLARQNGYHLIQTYLPTFLIVTISWVSFWLNIDATPARVTLGVTTLLTMTTVASGVRTQLPPVSYVKAIDVWIGACSVMVFGALLEFTLVNYLSRSKMRPEEFRKSMNPFACMVRENGEIQLTELPKNRKKTPEAASPSGKDSVAQDDQMAGGNMRPHELQRNVKRAQMVDRASRIMFPFLFLVFNTVYWTFYLFRGDSSQ